MHFASFLSGGFTTMTVINPPETKLAKRTSVHYITVLFPIYQMVVQSYDCPIVPLYYIEYYVQIYSMKPHNLLTLLLTVCTTM